MLYFRLLKEIKHQGLDIAYKLDKHRPQSYDIMGYWKYWSFQITRFPSD